RSHAAHLQAQGPAGTSDAQRGRGVPENHRQRVKFVVPVYQPLPPDRLTGGSPGRSEWPAMPLGIGSPDRPFTRVGGTLAWEVSFRWNQRRTRSRKDGGAGVSCTSTWWETVVGRGAGGSAISQPEASSVTAAERYNRRMGCHS